MQDRIDHFESLVLGLMQRQQQPAATPDEPGSQYGSVLDHIETDVDAGVGIDLDVPAEPESSTDRSQAMS